MQFEPAQLKFSGIFNKKFTWTVDSAKFERYGTYVGQYPKSDIFSIKMSLWHVLGVLRISEIIGGRFSLAMEQVDEDDANCFLFSEESYFQFLVLISSVAFEDLSKDGAQEKNKEEVQVKKESLELSSEQHIKQEPEPQIK